MSDFECQKTIKKTWKPMAKIPILGFSEFGQVFGVLSRVTPSLLAKSSLVRGYKGEI
jgi:hypothetical protein